ncbi:MAG: D-glycero-beta-D-manno-heptose-7-phosphate kinase, partial [Thioalkalispiraceae bacterium]
MKISIPDFKNSKVLVVGDLMLDRYWHGDTSRISPEAPVPVVRVGDAEERAGGAGNVALNIAALGGATTVVGLVGDDEAAMALQKVLEYKKIKCNFQTVVDSKTITKLRIISRHQQLIRLDFEDGFTGCDHSGLNTQFQHELDSTSVVVLSDYDKGTLQDIQTLITLAREAGKTVLVDPKGDDFSRYKGASLITPNLAEFEAVVGACHSDDELVTRGMQLLDTLQLEALLVTRSEKGMTLLRHGHDALHLPALTREVFDVTGAGDTVIATLAAALAAGQDMDEATALANQAAGIVVSKLGTATVSIEELQHALRDEE